jgi:hypothetical protein
MNEENLIIENNLRLFKPLAYKVPVFELLDSKGNKTGNYSKGNEVASVLSINELITIDGTMCYLNDNGKKLLKKQLFRDRYFRGRLKLLYKTYEFSTRLITNRTKKNLSKLEKLSILLSIIIAIIAIYEFLIKH